MKQFERSVRRVIPFWKAMPAMECHKPDALNPNIVSDGQVAFIE
jgi:hypothetical protein